MIDTKAQYEEYGSSFASDTYSRDDWGTFWDNDIRPTIEALREVARAGAQLRQVWRDKGHGGKEEVLAHIEIAKTVDALPDWILE